MHQDDYLKASRKNGRLVFKPKSNKGIVLKVIGAFFIFCLLVWLFLKAV